MSQPLLDESYQQNQLPPSFCFRQQNWRTFICQLIGTGILVTGVCLTTYKNPVDQHVKNTTMMHDLYVLVSLYMARIFFAPLTGGYFNTAVTLGVFINKNSSNKITAKRLGFFVAGQLIGAVIGVTVSKLIYNVNAEPFASNKIYSIDEVVVRFFGELIGATIFVHMVLILTTSDTTFINEECWVHLFVPIFLYGGRKMSKYIDGLNPFEMISFQIVTSFFTQNGQPIQVVYILMLAVGQLLGGVLAGFFFNFVYYPMLMKWRNHDL